MPQPLLSRSLLFFCAMATVTASFPWENQSSPSCNRGDFFEHPIFDQGAFSSGMFFAPYSEHCMTAVPEFQKAASALKGFIKVGAVDTVAQKSIASHFGFIAYPTILIFTGNGKSVEYDGKRTAEAIVATVMHVASRIAGAGEL